LQKGQEYFSFLGDIVFLPVIARERQRPRQSDGRDCHVASLLAMTERFAPRNDRI
jgi:hypothetical protein